MEEMLTYEQLSRRTGIKVNTLYGLVSQRRIPHVRIGRRLVRFDPVVIERWLRDKYVVTAEQEVTP